MNASHSSPGGGEEGIVHSPGTGNFKCECGTRLAFNVGHAALTVLTNQRRDGLGKIGTCPTCGRLHEVPALPKTHK